MRVNKVLSIQVLESSDTNQESKECNSPPFNSEYSNLVSEDVRTLPAHNNVVHDNATN